jgi:hypothetical protein
MSSLLARVRVRVQTNLPDIELQMMINGITAELADLYDPVGPIIRDFVGPPGLCPHLTYLRFHRPIDVAEELEIIETRSDEEIALEIDDYRILYGGRLIQRLSNGSNPYSYWSNLVSVQYTPLSAGQQASLEEAIIRLVALQVEYSGLQSERKGDWSVSYYNFAEERGRILASLGRSAGGAFILA